MGGSMWKIGNIEIKNQVVYNNSGIISTKLSIDKKREDILNHLQVFFLCDLGISELKEICDELIKKDIPILLDNNYNSSINIIFSICELINESDYTIDGKTSLKNKIRKYMMYLKYDESIRALNNSYVKIKKETTN